MLNRAAFESHNAKLTGFAQSWREGNDFEKVSILRETQALDHITVLGQYDHFSITISAILYGVIHLIFSP